MLLCKELGLQLNITVGPFHTFFFFFAPNRNSTANYDVGKKFQERIFFFPFYLSQVWSKEVFLYFTSSGLLFFVFPLCSLRAYLPGGSLSSISLFPLATRDWQMVLVQHLASVLTHPLSSCFLWFGALEDFHFLSTSTIHLMICAFLKIHISFIHYFKVHYTRRKSMTSILKEL